MGSSLSPRGALWLPGTLELAEWKIIRNCSGVALCPSTLWVNPRGKEKGAAGNAPQAKPGSSVPAPIDAILGIHYCSIDGFCLLQLSPWLVLLLFVELMRL